MSWESTQTAIIGEILSVSKTESMQELAKDETA